MRAVIFHGDFLKQCKRIPIAEQKKLDKLIAMMRKNPFDPILHVKYLHQPLKGFLSFRITRDWRVIFKFLDAHTIQLISVKHRKDIYR